MMCACVSYYCKNQIAAQKLVPEGEKSRIQALEIQNVSGEHSPGPKGS